MLYTVLMIEERKYCSDMMKEDFNKELVMTIMLMMILTKEIIFISLENIEALYIEIVISKLN